MLTIGQHIIQQRRNLGMSIGDLSIQTSLSCVDIENIENSVNLPRLHVLYRIAKGLGVPMGVLLVDVEQQMKLAYEQHQQQLAEGKGNA